MAIETLSTMRSHLEGSFSDVAGSTRQEKATFQSTRQSLDFQLQTLKSLEARSKSNQSRLQNEITLVSDVWVV